MKPVEIFCFSLLLTVIIVSCDAPHSNPLESYVVKPDTVHRIDTTIVPPDVYAVEGYITSLHSTPIPLQNVLVSWNRSNSIKTNSSGFFRIANIEKQTGWLYFSKEGYIDDSLEVVWSEADTAVIARQLNMKPVLTNEDSYSIIINDYPDHTYGSLILSGTITDDNYQSITRVTIRNTTLGFSKNISLDAEHKFNVTLPETELLVNDIDNVVGKNFSVVVRYGTREYESGVFNISRVIRNFVEYIAPANGIILTTRNPYLEWKKVSPGFSFTYTIEVYTNEITPQMVWSTTNIEPESITKRVGAQLINGDYFWVIWIVDEFGNKSRSKPATFSILSED